MNPRESEIAQDFEKGWSDERLNQAEVSWGPGLANALPHALAKRVEERAVREGKSDLEVIEAALNQYFSTSDVA